MQQAFLEVDNLWRRFGSTQALAGLNLQIPERSVTALVGANGAGKTTTFSIIGRFIRPNQGTVRVAGLSLDEFWRRGNCIGLLPQDMQFFESRTIRRQLLLFARLAGFSGAAAAAEVDRVLDLSNLRDKASSRAEELSRGMKVRLGVSQAFIGSPPLILLDEPTAGLDPKMVAAFRETIAAVRGTTTLVISSHDLRELEELCDYVCIVDRGKLVRQGPMSEVLSGSSQVVFDVTAVPVDLEALREVSPEIRVVVGKHNELRIDFDPQAIALDQLNRRVLEWLLARDVGVLGVRARKSLEQTFFDATREDATGSGR